jgi:hypothetical protein
MNATRKAAWGLAVLLALAGCAPTHTGPAAGGDEAAVRDAFAALKGALAERDGDRLRDLLDADTLAAAERSGKALKVSASDYLKSDHFRGLLEEVPGGQVKKVTIQGDRATVVYDEGDGDDEKLLFVREGGRWKASVPIP